MFVKHPLCCLCYSLLLYAMLHSLNFQQKQKQKKKQNDQTRKLSAPMSRELPNLNSPLILVVLHLACLLLTCCSLLNSSPFHLSPGAAAPRGKKEDQRDAAAHIYAHTNMVFFSHPYEEKVQRLTWKSGFLWSLRFNVAAKSAPGGQSYTARSVAFFQCRFSLWGFPSAPFHTVSGGNCIIENSNCVVIIALVLITSASHLLIRCRRLWQLSRDENWWLSLAQN